MIIEGNPRGVKRKKLIIGLDPEFLLLNKDKSVISSYSIIGSNYGAVGTDGTPGEFRPKPGTPVELTKTMKGLYGRLDKKIKASRYKDVKVFAGGGAGAGLKCTQALGGHIHFNIAQDKELVKFIDDFIGIPLKAMKGGKRPGNYGNYGIVGECYGKSYGFEYRTPPSFIGKPDLFEGVVAVAYCIARTWKKVSNTDSLSFVYGDKPTPDDYRKLVCYKRYKRQIENFISYVTEKKSMVEHDALAAWEINGRKLTDITV